MFGILNKPKNTKPEINVNQVVEEIHETFYTEVDKLLEYAKIQKSLETNKQNLIDKANRLKAIGFNNTKEVQEAEIEIDRLEKINKENKDKKELIEAINHFSFKYYNYKFITEESVKKICEKYNLIYGESKYYTGTIPYKNLKHIEEFKIDENDECYISYNEYFIGGGIRRFGEQYLSKEKAYLKKEVDEISRGLYIINPYNNYGSNSREFLEKCPLEIVAPIKDFNTSSMEVKDFKLSKIEIPDPVVLKPVVYNNKKYYLIVTAWGIESNDELIINEKMN